MSLRPRRSTNRPNYKLLADIDLPKAKRSCTASKKDELYAVTIEERQDTRVKVHYVGYGSQHDEWRDEADIVPLDVSDTERDCDPVPRPFSLYSELRNKIKTALSSGRKESPVVRIDMPFDKLQFDGGLKQYGIFVRTFRGIDRYNISHYRDLNVLLGKNWHFRGLNSQGDFCYVIKGTVEFYLHKRHPLQEFFPTEEGVETLRQTLDLGYMLIFNFVRGDGTPTDFGKDRVIFYE